MAHRTVHGAPAEVRAVLQQFRIWRSTRRPGERIPPPLWKLAVRLAGIHGRHRVACWLGLNPTRLRDRAGRSSPPAASFVEVEGNVPPGLLLGGPAAEYALELGQPAGETLRIRVRGATSAEVVALAQALRPCPGPR